MDESRIDLLWIIIDRIRLLDVLQTLIILILMRFRYRQIKDDFTRKQGE